MDCMTGVEPAYTRATSWRRTVCLHTERWNHGVLLRLRQSGCTPNLVTTWVPEPTATTAEMRPVVAMQHANALPVNPGVAATL